MSRRCACGLAKAARAYTCALCRPARCYDWKKRNLLRKARRQRVRDISAEKIDLLFNGAKARQRFKRAA